MSTAPARRPPDPHFPAMHLRPPHNWVNDPNGLVFHDGLYHVFFQYNPYSSRHRAMHWGHFTSPDLLNWTLQPIALAPSPGSDDAEGVWSGNAISHDGTLTAFYSAKHPDRWYQPIAAATSTDGVHFAKYPGLLVAEPPPGLTMFRDPYVWFDASADCWRMLVGAALEDGRGATVQYATPGPDALAGWCYQGVFLAHSPVGLPDGRNTEEGWECAQYASFGEGRGAILVSAWDPSAGAQATAVWPGRETSGDAFTVDAPQLLDHGPDFYAPALLAAPDGRWLLWAWVWEARDEPAVGAPGEWIDEAGWAGMLSLPRELSLDESGLVRQRPARELDNLRMGAPRRQMRDEAADEGQREIGRVSDIEARLSDDAGLRIVTSTDGTEFLEIRREAVTGDVIVDRSHASQDARAKQGAWRVPGGSGQAELRILLDHSVCELFTAEGRSLTVRFYPVGDAEHWLLCSTGTGDYEINVWELDARSFTDLRPAPGNSESGVA